MEDKDEIQAAKTTRPRLVGEAHVSLETRRVCLEFRGTSFCLGCGEHLNELLILELHRGMLGERLPLEVRRGENPHVRPHAHTHMHILLFLCENPDPEPTITTKPKVQRPAVMCSRCKENGHFVTQNTHTHTHYVCSSMQMAVCEADRLSGFCFLQMCEGRITCHWPTSSVSPSISVRYTWVCV